MKYRWGFLDENDIFSECFPIISDDTSLEYAQESGQMFYRAKLNGELAFRFEYDAIISAGYNYTHRVVLQRYDEDAADYVEVWQGRFTMTDCTVNVDTKTISVQPETIDRYTKILDHLADEYNLLKINPTQKAVNINIRPCCQLYSLNDSKLVNVIGGISWEQSCDTLSSGEISNYNGVMQSEKFSIALQFGSDTWSWLYNDGKPVFFVGTPDYSGSPQRFDLTPSIPIPPSETDGQFFCQIEETSEYTRFIVDYKVFVGGIWNGYSLCRCTYEKDEAGTPATYDYYTYAGLSVVDGLADWQKIYERWILYSEEASITISGVTHTLIDIPADDMAGLNQNYNKIINGFSCTNIYADAQLSETPTQWGQSLIEGWYFMKDTSYNLTEIPIGQGVWRVMSIWAHIAESTAEELDSLAYKRRIRDCYTLPSVIFRLMKKADVSLNFSDSSSISEFLFGTTSPLGYDQFYLLLTPKSNIISSYYNNPAQNAPISLQDITMMLKTLFKVYWFIDNDNNLRFEHIMYFENGMTYTDSAPQVLVDLNTTMHTNTKSVKDFGQNTYKFDKADMPATYTYEFADTHTIPFEGYPMKAQDAYVQQGVIQEETIAKFSADIDYILASPSEVSKDGFALLAAPVVGGTRIFTLDIKKLDMRDEDGAEWEYRVQNPQCAVGYLAETFLRYNLPCENWLINNKGNTAVTTGNFKLQSLEYADIISREIVDDINNCIKVIQTQQGNGHIKTMSIILNSLTTKTDLLFNFVGRWYYLKGTALGASFTITLNGETITISVSNNSFVHRYKEAITSLTFDGADVVSVNLADCDSLDSLTSTDDMFKNCEELIAVDFGGKTFGAVTTANNMFRGCVALTTLICPDSSTWKADLDLSDCPNFTLESFYDLIKFLYFYESGVHTITPNSTMWNALDGDTQTDLIAKATERGWTINMPAAYSITGQSAGNTVYATINGSPIEIPVTAGQWQYDYNAAITSISFENDADLTSVEFSLSDGLAGVTSLNDAFKNCAGLTSVDFTDCDLTNLVSASDAFAGCTSLYELIIPAGTWKPDVDLSATAIAYAEMSNVVGGLYTYTSGTHTITFNSTIWDALSVVQQQTIFDAAQLKWWTTNAVAVVYYIKGTSTAATETFTLRFIDDSTQAITTETITCVVDGNGNWEHQYNGKKIYSLANTFYEKTTMLSIEFSEDFEACTELASAFLRATMATISMPNAILSNVTSVLNAFKQTNATIVLPLATFASVVDGGTSLAGLNGNGMFFGAQGNINLPSASFASLVNARGMFFGVGKISSSASFASVVDAYGMFSEAHEIDLQQTTFASVTNAENMFGNAIDADKDMILPLATFASVTNALGMCADNKAKSISMPNATFGNCTNMTNIFLRCVNATSISMPIATFASAANASNVRGIFYGCTALQSINWQSATLQSIIYTTNIFYTCNVLQNISVPTNSTAIAQTATPSNTPIDARYSPLTYQSMYNLASWVRDFTGYSAHTMTFKTSAWNALSSAEQNTIDGILSGKNWTRAIA